MFIEKTFVRHDAEKFKLNSGNKNFRFQGFLEKSARN